MKLQEMMNNIQKLGNQIKDKNQELANASANGAALSDLHQISDDLQELQERLAAAQKAYDLEKGMQSAGVTSRNDAEGRSVTEMRKSNEYARAFAYAIRNGINRRSGRGNEKVAILYDALTEGGGSTPGEDGGFLVPIDMDNTIHELKRTLNPLSALFNQETVSAPTGWRVMDTAPTTGMSQVNEMATIQQNDQPAFSKIPYSLSKYGLIVPVSHELLSDEAAGLMAYLSRWFAKKLVLTENSLILTLLQGLTASALTPSKTGATPIDGIKTVLNKVLDPALSNSAFILTNQDGFDELDQVKDDYGRGLLQPDPTNPTLYRIFGRPVHKVSNAVMPSTTGNSAAADIYIGDGREFATLFSKDGFEVASTDIGGNAWATDSTEVRGIARLDVRTFDTAAMARRSISL